MGMKDRSLIEKINPTFFALTTMAMHHYLSACKTGKIWVPQGFGPGGVAQRKCDTRNSNPAVNDACTDVFRHLDVDICSSLPEVPAKKIDIIRAMSRRRIHSTGTDQSMAQPHNDQGSCEEDFLDYIAEELIELPDNSFNCLSSFVAAAEASMWFSAVLPMGVSAIASSS